MSVFLELSVADTGALEATGPVSLARADRLAAAAAEAGAVGLRLTEGHLDPTVVAAYLAGHHPGLILLVDAATDHNAPYNLARRLLSLDRATGGNIQLVLHPGQGDEVSDTVARAGGQADTAAGRWAEYATILTGLWESFPREALLGDQERGVFADDSLIRPIAFDGDYYRVAGPLDGPALPQGRPAIIADPVEVGWSRAVDRADAVIVDVAAGTDLNAVTAGDEESPSVAVLLRAPVTEANTLVGQLATSRIAASVTGVILTGVTDSTAPVNLPDLVRALSAALPAPGSAPLSGATPFRASIPVGVPR